MKINKNRPGIGSFKKYNYKAELRMSCLDSIMQVSKFFISNWVCTSTWPNLLQSDCRRCWWYKEALLWLKDPASIDPVDIFEVDLFDVALDVVGNSAVDFLENGADDASVGGLLEVETFFGLWSVVDISAVVALEIWANGDSNRLDVLVVDIMTRPHMQKTEIKVNILFWR